MDAEAFFDLVQSHLRKNGNTILIVGSRTTNFSRKLRENSKLIFWDSTDPDTFNKRSLPESVSLIIFLRWIPHALQDKICDWAKAAGVALDKKVRSTGEVKRALTITEESVAIVTLAKEKASETITRVMGREATPALKSSGEDQSVPVASAMDVSPAPTDADEILGRLMSDEDLPQLAMERFLEDFRKAKEDLRKAEEEKSKLLGLRAENERLQREIEELREYREAIARLARLVERTKSIEASQTAEHA